MSAAENTRVGFPGRSVSVRNETRSVPVTVGDSARLHQVVGNLVTNAMRHAGEEASVTIRLSRPDEDMVAVEVIDDGDGISADDVPHLFERFYRADVSRSRASGGSGLGLSIVKRLIELHNGTITVESELGEGTTFRILLPVWRDDEEQDEGPDEEPDAEFESGDVGGSDSDAAEAADAADVPGEPTDPEDDGRKSGRDSGRDSWGG